MKLKDLIEPSKKYEWSIPEPILQGRLIALDGGTGKQLFDTHKNKAEYVKQFYEAEIGSIWASNKSRQDHGFTGEWFQPVTMVFLSHNSWLINSGETE